MMLATKILKVLFGKSCDVDGTMEGKIATVRYSTGVSPFNNESFSFRLDDGLVPTLLETIKKLESKVESLDFDNKFTTSRLERLERTGASMTTGGGMIGGAGTLNSTNKKK